MPTQFLHVLDNAGKWSLYVADDEPAVINSFRKVFETEARISEIDANEFATAISRPPKGQTSIAVLDGNMVIDGESTELGAWLATVGVASNPKLTLVGLSGDARNRTPLCKKWYVKGKDVERDVADIMRLIGQGIDPSNWPETLGGGDVDALTSGIHTLQNLFLPMDLDAGTLGEILAQHTRMGADGPLEAAQLETVRCIHDEYFGLGTSCYLGQNSIQHDGKDIVSFVATVCERFYVKVEITAFCSAVQKARKEAGECEELVASDMAKCARQMHEALTMISKAGNTLVDGVRVLRNKRV